MLEKGKGRSTILAAALMLAACGGSDSGGEGGGQPEPSVTPVPTATPAPTATIVNARAWASLDRRIFRSDDGGRNWRAVADEAVTGLHFVDRERGWAATFPSHILHTNDGGSSWISQGDNIAPGVQIGLLRDVAFLNAQQGAIVGNGPEAIGGFESGPALALVTDDGGASWREATIDARGNDALVQSALLSVCFTETGIGLACGGALFSRSCLLSTDVGETWVDISAQICPPGLGCPPEVVAIACVGAGDLWIAGSTLMHSADGGTTWQVKTNNLPPERRGVATITFADPLNGWIAGRASVPRTASSSAKIPFVLRTSDGGVTWVEQTLPGVTDQLPLGLEGAAHQIAAIPSAHAVLLGEASLGVFGPPFLRAFGYVTTDGATWEESATPPPLSDLGGEFGVVVADVAIVP